MSRAELTSRSRSAVHPVHAHALVPRPAIALGPQPAWHAEQVWVDPAALTSRNSAVALMALGPQLCPEHAPPGIEHGLREGSLGKGGGSTLMRLQVLQCEVDPDRIRRGMAGCFFPLHSHERVQRPPAAGGLATRAATDEILREIPAVPEPYVPVHEAHDTLRAALDRDRLERAPSQAVVRARSTRDPPAELASAVNSCRSSAERNRPSRSRIFRPVSCSSFQTKLTSRARAQSYGTCLSRTRTRRVRTSAADRLNGCGAFPSCRCILIQASGSIPKDA